MQHEISTQMEKMAKEAIRQMLNEGKTTAAIAGTGFQISSERPEVVWGIISLDDREFFIHTA